MARDRQRAKARKARRAQNPGPKPTEPHRANVPGELDHVSGVAEEFDAAIISGAEGDAADDGLGADISDAEIERQAIEAGTSRRTGSVPIVPARNRSGPAHRWRHPAVRPHRRR